MMTVETVLRGKAKIGDVIIFLEAGWQIGCTRKDNEDLYFRSLSSDLLKREVRHYSYEERDWLINKALILRIW